MKAQVLAGGRGKGYFSSGLCGGVQLTKDVKEAGQLVERMIGYQLVTNQTSKDGVKVQKVMIAEAKDLAHEAYFAIILDRTTGGPILIGSPKGGIDIEAVAESNPELIFKEPVDLDKGPTEGQLERMADNLGLNGNPKVKQQAIDQMSRLFKLFTSVDATQIEINPFGVTPDNEVLCFDAKINFDDNAAFRQKSIFSQQDNSSADQRELIAQEHQLNYIGMEGNIGCLVNGAGLAMATMDILKLYGGSPANFLDVGGGAQPNQIATAYKLLVDDENVKSIFVNIFGGIMRCDLIAEGILQAVKDPKIRSVPLVIRLAGTNDKIAKDRLISEYPGRVQVFDDLDKAAEKAVLAAELELGFN